MSEVIVTNTENVKNLKTPKDCNGVHIMWSVVATPDLTTPIVDPSAIQLNFFGVAPRGELVPFDGNPYLGNVYEISPTTYSGDRQIQVEVVGLTAAEAVIVDLRGLF